MHTPAAFLLRSGQMLNEHTEGQRGQNYINISIKYIIK